MRENALPSKAQNREIRASREGDKNQARVYGDVLHPESVKQFLIADEEREDEKHQRARGDRNRGEAQDVAEFEMADFVGEDRDEFICGLSLHQRVEKHEPLEAPESREKRIAFRRTARAVHRVDPAHLKAIARVVLGDGGFEFPVRKFLELVEERQQNHRRQINEHELKHGESEPGVEPGHRARGFKEINDARENRSADEIAPMTAPLIRSRTKVPGVVLLNPNFSSITKVL